MLMLFLMEEAAMVKEELENLREQINIMMVSEKINSDALLGASRELDTLIIKFMNIQEVIKNK